MLLILVVADRTFGFTYNEGTSGDLSNSQGAPSGFSLGDGLNSIIGTVGSGDSQDWVGLLVPTGKQLSSLILASYQSSDSQGFIGVQMGTAFIGNPETDASAYLGYAHFGTSASNGPHSGNLVGQDFLPIMGNTADAPGSHGFTPPLPAGEYVFLIQQLGASTNYEFDFNATAVPEPATLGMLLSGGSMFVLVAFARAAKARRSQP